MERVLYINGCVRDESRTARLAEAVLDRIGGEQAEINLEMEKIPPLYKEELRKRDELIAAEDFDDTMFDYAHMVKDADIIVMAAPYWDLSFPSFIKIFMEAVTVTGLTFTYTEEGYPMGLCNGKKFIYVTTSGGSIGPFNFGYDYLKTVFTGMFGIGDCQMISAENLDIVGNDPEKILAETIEKLDI